MTAAGRRWTASFTAAFVTCCAVALLSAASAYAQAAPARVLVFQGTPNATTTSAVNALNALDTANDDFTVTVSQDAGVFTTAGLAPYEAVVFLSSAPNALTPEQETALDEFVADGHGFVGAGAAAQAESSPASTVLSDLIGARPNPSSPGNPQSAVVEVPDRVHPATRDVPLEWQRTDSWFNWTTNPAGSVHTVAVVRERSYTPGTGAHGLNHPISWCRDINGGRSFFTGMGRTSASFAEDDMRDHLLGAVRWTAGLSRANCKATINANYTATRLTQANSPGTLNNTGEPHGLDIAEDGRIVYIGRAAGRPIITDWSNPSIGLGAGTVHVYDPDTNQVTLAATLDVFGNKGNGAETVKIEEGLVGIALDENFLDNGYVYLHYTPHSQVNRATHMAKRRVSRFTMDLATNTLAIASEKVILEWDVQADRCCHAGGGMAWDSQGNLYIATGDTNSSGCDGCPGGYSGNVAPPNFLGMGQQDARRTAGNTNNLNGKILRIKPLATPGDTPGEGTTYTVPAGGLFTGAEEGGGKTRREIFAMGVRNPSRIWVDPVTDWVVTAWVGPDAGGPSTTWGPAKYESAAVMAEAGNYGGWPYCMGNQQPYRDRHNTNVTQALDWYDCDNIVNDSPHNDGLRNIPPARPVNLWYSPQGGCPDYPRNAAGVPSYIASQATFLCPGVQGGGQAIMNGPIFRYDADNDSAAQWPEYWSGKWFVGDFQGSGNIRHALTLDPDTAPEGGLPTSFTPLSGIITPTAFGDSALMDWKFGPDGALYVQHYGGNYFSIGSTSGVWKFEYTGGESTPSANATATPTTGVAPLQVQFNGSRSGGVSYLWDFGDNSADSTEADPQHTYQDEGDYTATLTVTYADGSTSTDEIEINVLGEPDTTPPVTTAAFNPADPGNGGTYDRPVTLTLTATDGNEGTGIQVIEYRVDGGAWQTYTAPFRVARVGNHVVEYRATDKSGNVEDIKQVTFSIVLHPACLTATDEFNAATLDPKWTVENPTSDGALTVGDGGVSIKVRNGDMIGATATARNLLLQTAPSGQWIIDTKLNITQLANEGEQAGLVLVESIAPNNFVKIVYINKGGGTRWFEYVLTEGDSTIRLPNSGNQNIPASGDVYLRAVSNGSGTVRAYWSLDGTNWTQVGPDITGLDVARVGVKVSDNANTENAAKFDYFRLDCADRAAPVTFASVSPDTPDGKLGWYDDAPRITLNATDGELGSGVARTEYRYGTTGLFQTYTGEFEVDRDGPLTIQYRSTDGADTPNTEAIKTLSLKVDANAPETTATLDPAQPGTGPVTVSLNTDDGAGAGLQTLEYRVDGGDWRTYSEPASDRTILDGTQASFAQWKQAGPGSFTHQPDGSIHANSGLGMLWYTGEQFGDFALKFQFRDAQTGTAFSNGGAFVRFPHPDETIAAPAAARPSCVSATENRPAWVAIFCGHEIQVYDGPTGEAQKTGSIYNFDSLTLPQSGAGQRSKGEWNDYEIRVIGQQYTIVRNGVVLNTFDNGLPRESSRGGDPPTQARQFAQGYVGFQNHGDADLIQYRNVRVQKLDGASRTGSGPFTVSGAGNHTVEFRSTDWAGHTEDKKSITFRIASTTQNPGVTPEELPTFRLAGLRGGTAKRFASRGLVVSVTCTGEMEGRVQVTATRKVMRRLGLNGTRLASRFVRCADAGTRAVTVKPSRKVARKLRRARRAVKVTVTVRLASAGESPTTVTRRLTLRR